MFWGLVLEPGKRYSTTVEKGFHVSKAALDCSSVRNDSEILSVMLETEGSEALLCSLCKGKGILQENLDLNFMSGDRLTFECRGHGRIHLTGYLLPEEDDISGMLGDEDDSEEEEDESEWSGALSPDKPKKEKRKSDTSPGGPSKKKKASTLDETKDSDSDADEESDLSDEMDDDEMEDEEDDDDDDDDDVEDESEEEEKLNLSQKEKKKQKEDKNKTPNKQNLATPKKTPVTNGVSPKDQKSNKKTPGSEKTPGGGKTPGGDKTPNNASPKHKQVLDQGVVVKEIKVGSGAPAKFGRTVSVHYIGKLKDTGKVFDKQTKGEGFKFKLGKGEVIKGWDIGVLNMKVGGKRVIHCPPEAAYGAKGVPPKIPPNSTLIFDVELKNVF